jgi:hypothetical protein
MYFNLHPPYLKSKGTNDFSKAWELFCLNSLRLRYSDDALQIRDPKDGGVDIYYPKLKLAFQCKSTISGNATDFNINNSKKSFETAISNRKTIGWEKYCLCLNHELTGNQTDNLKKAFVQILNEKQINESIDEIFILHTKEYWISICHDYKYKLSPFFENNMIGSLEALKYIKYDKYLLFNIFSKLEYNYEQSNEFSNLVKRLDKERRNDLFTNVEILLSELITLEETKENHREVMGFITNFLSKETSSWNPSKKFLVNISNSILKILKQDNIDLCGVVEPLSFAVGVKGEYFLHKKYIETSIVSTQWRQADSQRVFEYYKNETTQTLAFLRHLEDERRIGLLLFANDVSRILENLEIAMKINPQETLIVLYTRLLNNILNTLKELGENDLIKIIQKYKEDKEL